MLRPGDFVGPYEIRGFVGQGGMGQVYRAYDPRLERTIALKVIVIPEDARPTVNPGDLDASKRADSAARLGDLSARMLREARAVASLSHPNVVAIYDVGESNGRLYLAMEFVVGASLRSMVGDAEVPLARRVRWLVDVARALEAAHKAGIIHRDIKPENVMVREDGVVKVLDFGIARRTVQGAAEQAAIDTLTGSGTIAGTPVYMAPEQIKGGEIDARADQFAWGVMAYELMAGQRPWPEGGDVLSLVAKILTEPPRPLRSLATGVPAVVDETIARTLAKDAAARFPAIGDVVEALEPFATTTTGGERVKITPVPRAGDDPAYAATTRIPTTVSVPPSAEPRASGAPAATPARSRPLSLAAPLFLLGALAAAVYVVKTRPPGPPPIVTTASATAATAATASASAPRPLSTVPAAEAAYREAMSLWHDGAGAKARTQLNQAIELDPAFAAAHLQLALQQAADGDPAAAQGSFASAYEHRQMLSARDSLLLEASQPFVRPKPDVEEWETRMTAVVFQHPRDADLQFYLGRAHARGGDLEAAKDAYEKALKLDEGFVPALAALAQTQKNLGRVADGLATTERCMKRSPIASTCVQARYELLFSAGECKRAREEAAQWVTLEPQSPKPLAALARALHADGAPRPSVEEVLARRWTLLPTGDRKQEETRDRLYLAVLDGETGRADELARELEAELPLTADTFDHAVPTRIRVNLLLELDRPKEAAKVAHTFLDRMAAWPVYPFAPDPSIDFYEALYRAGELTKTELEARRAEWIDREKQRTDESRTAHDPWVIWARVYGSFAETREEALEAVAKAPKDRHLPVGARRSLFLDFVLGKIDALTGRAEQAIAPLGRVVDGCSTFDDPMQITKGRYYLGLALEAKGETAKARALYEKVVEAWPAKTGGRTAKLATERLATMTRN